MLRNVAILALLGWPAHGYGADPISHRQLQEGLARNDGRPLKQFLETWQEDSEPVPPAQLAKKPRIEQEVYSLFQAFWRPAQMYEETDYSIVQNNLRVAVVESDLDKAFRTADSDRWGFVRSLPTISRFTIHDFRPQLADCGKKVLYLDSEHLRDLVLFLIGNVPEKVESYQQEDNTAQERRQRLSYLNTVLHILPGHFDRGWHFETHPEVGWVYLSDDFTHAIVFYREQYGGGEALMRRDADGWFVVDKDRTWTE